MAADNPFRSTDRPTPPTETASGGALKNIDGTGWTVIFITVVVVLACVL